MEVSFRLKQKADSIAKESLRMITYFNEDSRSLLEAIFLLTLDQDFIMNIGSDGKVDIHEM